MFSKWTQILICLLLVIVVFLLNSQIVLAEIKNLSQPAEEKIDLPSLNNDESPDCNVEKRAKQINWEYILNLVVALISFLLLLSLLSKYENKSD